MGNKNIIDVTKEQLDEATAMWMGFTKLAKIGVIVTCVSLGVLAIILL